jgi:hypothetical protein
VGSGCDAVGGASGASVILYHEYNVLEEVV